ncbi:MAG: class B sortase [Clostridia bacterium]|nr:class B sortase [Clostridia bacterium]
MNESISIGARRRAQTGRARRRRQRRIYGAVSLISLLLCLSLLAGFLFVTLGNRSAEQTNQRLNDIFHGVSFSPRFRFSLIAQASAEEAEDGEPISSRLSELYAINPDLIGWLIAGEDISEPVVLRDNSYYLDHDFYGEKSKSGTVFADELNAEWQTDPVLIVYGHNMRNGSMFGKMTSFRKQKYFAAQGLFEFYSTYDDSVTYYAPFAVFDASMNEGNRSYFYLRRYDSFGDEAGLSDYLEEIRSRSIMDVPVDVNAQDQILCLVTCSYSNSNGRLMLFARALRPSETREEMEALVAEAKKK